jgi:hypothetical protein
MADRTHKTVFELSATDRATQVFKGVEGGLKSLQGSYLALGAAAAAAFGAGSFFGDLVRYRAALDDLHDTTGDNVRTLDAMARQARISGLEFERFETSLTRFARNLNATDDEGTAAAQAIAALGLNVEELRAKKPADAMLDVARALGKFEDGASKVAVAVALMGKEGAKQLPFMKDLAEAQDLQGRLTAEQVAQAERLTHQWQRLKIAFEDSKDGIATGLIPYLADMIEQMREGTRIAGGFWNAMSFGMSIDPFKSIGENIAERMTALELLKAQRAERAPRGYADELRDMDFTVRQSAREIEFLRFQQRQEALKLTGPEYLDVRDLMARQKPRLDFVPAKAGAAGKPDSYWTPQMEEMFQARRAAAKELDDIAAKEEAEAARLEKLKGGYLDLIDPIRAIERQWADVEELRRKNIITEEEYLDLYVHLAAKADELRRKQEGLDKATERADNAFAKMGFTATSALEDIIIKGGDARDVIKALGQDLARIIFRASIGDPLAEALGGAVKGIFSSRESSQASSGDFSAGGGFEGVDWGGAFAGGGGFTVPGSGGTDSRLVAFRATPGEQVDIRTSGQRAAAGHSFYIDARGADPAAIARLENTIKVLHGSIERRAVAANIDAARRGMRP